MSKTRPRINILYIKITEDIGFTEEEHAITGDIYEVFVYDSNQRTFCCEFTPSYWLVSAGVQTEKWVDDEEHPSLYEDLQRMGGGSSDNSYMHCSDVDKAPSVPLSWLEKNAKTKPGTMMTRAWAPGFSKAESSDDAIEDCLEYIRTNTGLTV